ncbi:MAG TPA: Wzt carbohydrate-binding domain-containing protein [Anaerolineales bacterium]|nr:Wzt carbohydrate-binding domain-containing protein [Anaerolineales bacterium]
MDHYLSTGFSQSGERHWEADEILADAEPFTPCVLRVRNPAGKVVDTVRSTEPTTIEIEYTLTRPVAGLRVGIYLMTMRGELIFTTFDTDDPNLFEQYGERAAGRYVSRCTIPADTLNEGRYAIGVNASSFRVKRYFHDERALAFNVDPTGAPGMHWPEQRLGMVRPRLDWQIEEI